MVSIFAEATSDTKTTVKSEVYPAVECASEFAVKPAATPVVENNFMLS
jgi:hypothetical protein